MNKITQCRLACSLAVATLVVTGCSLQPPAPGNGRYRIELEQIAESDNLVIVRLDLTFNGERKVKLYEESDSETATISPDSSTGVSECEILIVADRVVLGESSMLKWLHRIQGKGVKAGGPSTYQVEPGQTVAHLLDIHVKSGEYDLGVEQQIATFQGRPLNLMIEK